MPILYEHKGKTKYKEHLINKDLEQYGNIKWIEYIIIKNGKNKLLEYIETLFNICEVNHRWLNKSFIELFLERNPNIKKMGIIFQRLKIVLEKQLKINHNNVYKLDNFLETIQSNIYTICYYYCNQFKNNESGEIILDNIQWIYNNTYYNPIDITTFIIE